MPPVQTSNFDALVTIWADTEVTRFLLCRGIPVPKERTKIAIASFIEHWEKYSYGVWAIVENSSAKMIGYCGLRYLDELNETEVLYGLQKSHWGRGIVTRAAKAAVSFGFDNANLNRIIALAFPDNQASIRVMEKSGFCYEKSISVFNLDVICYSIETKENEVAK
ncbi:MAG: GNAT family N-acetyltransferase [Rhizonema sp. PD37]|nr:GNAT family N-acetyltransferase [Rhizonema sp. PD37]